MRRRLKENIEIGDRVFAPRDEYQGTVVDINGDEVLVDGPFGEEYHNLSDLEKLGGDYEEGLPFPFRENFTESRKKIIRLTESDLSKIVKRTIREMEETDKEKIKQRIINGKQAKPQHSDKLNHTAASVMYTITSHVNMLGCSEGKSRLLDDLSRMVDNAQREMSEEEFDKLMVYVDDLEQEIIQTCSDEEESLYESDLARIVKQVISESKKKPSKSEILKMSKDELKDVYGELEVKGEYHGNKGTFHNFKRTAIGDVVCSFRTDDTTPSGLKRNTQGIKVKNLDF